MKYDIVIPVAQKDYEIVPDCVKGARENCIDADKIYVISKDKLDIKDAIWIPEARFPYTKEMIVSRNPIITPQRSGWYLQQMIKLHCFNYIAELNEHDTVLMLDSDNVFLNPTEFFEADIPLYAHSNEYIQPYFEHMHRVHPDFGRSMRVSGICHHYIFQHAIIHEMMMKVYTHHQKPFFDVLIEQIRDPQSGMAENELYVHYLQRFHPTLMQLRQLKWTNDGRMSMYDEFKKQGFNYIACQAYNTWSRDKK